MWRFFPADGQANRVLVNVERLKQKYPAKFVPSKGGMYAAYVAGFVLIVGGGIGLAGEFAAVFDGLPRIPRMIWSGVLAAAGASLVWRAPSFENTGDNSRFLDRCRGVWEHSCASRASASIADHPRNSPGEHAQTYRKYTIDELLEAYESLDPAASPQRYADLVYVLRQELG